jgi:hypothetical protein
MCMENKIDGIGRRITLKSIVWLRQSLAIRQVAYHCSWYNSSRRFKKHFVFLVMRSQKPVLLTAGKCFAVPLDGFTEVVSTEIRVTLPFISLRILIFFWRHICWLDIPFDQILSLSRSYRCHFLSWILLHRNSLPQQADYHPRYWQSSQDRETDRHTPSVQQWNLG